MIDQFAGLFEKEGAMRPYTLENNDQFAQTEARRAAAKANLVKQAAAKADLVAQVAPKEIRMQNYAPVAAVITLVIAFGGMIKSFLR